MRKQQRRDRNKIRKKASKEEIMKERRKGEKEM
jgi:hypothetical protein